MKNPYMNAANTKANTAYGEIQNNMTSSNNSMLGILSRMKEE